MGKIGDIATLGVIAVVGYFALKNWDAIKDFFGGIGGIFDRGEQPEGTPWFVPPATQPYLPPEGVPPELLPDEMPLPPPTMWESIFPPLAFLPDEPQEVPFMPTPPSPPTIPETIFPPLVLIRPFVDLIAPPQSSPAPISPPIYTPTVPPVYQPDPELIPSDPSHPATDPFLGGR